MGNLNDPRIRSYAAADSDWHIDAAMSEISIQYSLDPSMYIAQEIVPVVPVGKESDKFYTWDKADWFRINDSLRARATSPKRIEASVSSQGYQTLNYMLEGTIPFEDLSNADEALEVEESTVGLVTQALMLDLENRVATLLTTAANVGSGVTLSGTNQWSDGANSSPLSDVSTAVAWVQQGTGFKPNTMVVGALVHKALLLHPDIHDRIKYVQAVTPKSVEAVLAQLFDVERYLVGNAVKNSGQEGQPADMSFIWGKHALLLYRPPRPGRRVPSLGYCFRWKPEGFTDFVVESKDDDDIKARRKRVGYFQDEKIVASDLGYLITNAVA